MPSSQKTFRIFVSSTFSDMRAERRILQEAVFPRLKSLCERRGAGFQAVDLRWGVNEEAQLDHKTMDICLNEIARCQKFSPKPNFIILMGDRYGWQPVPSRIPSTEMGLILGLVGQADAAFAKNWYREDLNAAPPEYVLQPRGDEYRRFDDWKAIEDRLRMLLRDAVNKLNFTEDQRIKYFASATHHEIIRGALNPPQDTTDPEEHVFAYMRNIRDLPEDIKAKDYIDIDLAGDTRDAYSKTQLKSLRDDLKGIGDKKGKLPEEHIYEYGAQWNDGCVVDDLTAFGERVYADLKRIIEQQLSEITEVDAITKEAQLHEKFQKDRLEHFTGQEEALKEIAGYLSGKKGNVLSIIGPSGSGKTSIMAKAIEDAISTDCPDASIVYRFAGATSGASDTHKLLYQIIQQITGAYGVDINSLLKEGEDEKIFSTVRGLKDILSRCLLLAINEKPLIIFIDALDQLSSDYASLSLDWLPQELPENVRMVISALPELKEKLLHTEIYEINPMSKDDGTHLLERWLRAINRTLKKEQREEVLNKFAANGAPLYLKLAFEKARTWQSYLEYTGIKPDIEGMLGEYFDGLQKTHGDMLVQKFCGYALSGKYQGLTESELLELFVFDREHWERFIQSSHPDHREEIIKLDKMPIVVWSRLFLDLEPYLAEKDATGFPIISFYHRQFAEYAVKRYLTEKEPYHKTLADYFETRWREPYIRALDELPWQRKSARDTAGIENVLTDLEFIEAKCRAEMNQDLVQDYIEALAREDTWRGRERIDEFHRFFMKASHVLRQYPELTFQQAMNQPDTSVPYKAADLLWTSGRRKRPWFRWVNKPQHIDPCIMTLEGHTEKVTSCAISSDGRRIVSGSNDHSLKVWDMESGAELATLKGHTYLVNCCAISPDSKRIVSGSDDYTLKVWDMESGAELATLKGHTWNVKCCAISPDGKRIVSGSWDRTLKVWDIESGAELATLKGPTGEINSCAISPDGKRIVFTEDHTLKVWDMESGAELGTLEGHTDWVKCCAISPDGRRIVSGSGDTLKVWDMESGAELATLKDDKNNVNSCAISPDGKRIVSGSLGGTLKVWDMESGAELATLKGHISFVECCAISPDGKRIVSGSDDTTLKVWDMESGVELATLKGHTYLVKCCAISPDGKRIVSGSDDTTLKVWDIESGAELATLKGHTWNVNCCAISPDSKRIVSGSYDDTLKVWDMESGVELDTLEGHTALVSSCAISPDSKRIVSGSYDHTLKVWDIENGAELGTLKGHTSGVSSCAISPDGKRIVSGSGDNTIKVWDMESGAELATYKGHTGCVDSCAISPDGRRIVSSSSNHDDHTLKVWDIENGAELATIEVVTYYGTSCFAISPEGKRIVSGSWDNTIKVWDMETGILLYKFDLLGRCLTSKIGCGGRFAVGDILGFVYILKLVGEETAEVPFVTPVHLWSSNRKAWDKNSTVQCQWCGMLFIPGAEITDAIADIARSASLGPSDSPCLKLPRQVWDDPRLLSECPHCHKPLRYNPFIVDNQDKGDSSFDVAPELNDEPDTSPSPYDENPHIVLDPQVGSVPGSNTWETEKSKVFPCPYCGGTISETKPRGIVLVYNLLLLIGAIALPFYSLWWLFLSVPMGLWGFLNVIASSTKNIRHCTTCGRYC
jgi:WD40 repeat protein